MDIISHALWSGALFKSINLKLKKKKFNFWNAAFWGIFPDLFAFIIPYLMWIFAIISGSMSLQDSIKIGATTSEFPYYALVEILYSISHSIIIFAIVFLLVWLIFRKPILILFGWLLHLLIDMFTHISGHFPAQIFWPLSNFEINGLIYWRKPLFMLGDMILLIITYLIIFIIEKKNKK